MGSNETFINEMVAYNFFLLFNPTFFVQYIFRFCLYLSDELCLLPNRMLAKIELVFPILHSAKYLIKNRFVFLNFLLSLLLLSSITLSHIQKHMQFNTMRLKCIKLHVKIREHSLRIKMKRNVKVFNHGIWLNRDAWCYQISYITRTKVLQP